jgi:NAD(P)-dependent dehydrogenase (short-subunit alcohol dehydrogenase family)
MGELDGRVAVVTGAGSGIGQGIASVLAREGANVVLTDIVRDNVEQLAPGLGGSALQHDVTSWDSCMAMADRVMEDKGRIDVLVNNAGVSRASRFTSSTAEWRWLQEQAAGSDGVSRRCSHARGPTWCSRTSRWTVWSAWRPSWAAAQSSTT